MSQVAVIRDRLRKYLAYLAVLAKSIDAAYEKTGNVTDRVRLSEVTKMLADERDIPVAYPFRRDVVKAARLIGYTRIINYSGVRYYQGVRKRS